MGPAPFRTIPQGLEVDGLCRGHRENSATAYFQAVHDDETSSLANGRWVVARLGEMLLVFDLQRPFPLPAASISVQTGFHQLALPLFLHICGAGSVCVLSCLSA